MVNFLCFLSAEPQMGLTGVFINATARSILLSCIQALHMSFHPTTFVQAGMAAQADGPRSLVRFTIAVHHKLIDTLEVKLHYNDFDTSKHAAPKFSFYARFTNERLHNDFTLQHSGKFFTIIEVRSVAIKS